MVEARQGVSELDLADAQFVGFLLIEQRMFNPTIFFCLIPVLIAAFIVFDKFVQLEYFAHRRDWEADGRPRGFFWVPHETTFAGGWLIHLGSSVARTRKSYVWLFSTPDWMRSRP
jgi:hypothetical protein